MVARIYIRENRMRRCRQKGRPASRRLERGALPKARCGALSRFLLSLALVHGLVSSPLLVECIRADGLLLIELIGHDPCRHPAMESGSEADPAAATVFRVFADYTQPCVDIIYENAAVTHTHADLQSASVRAAGARAGLVASLSAACDLWLLRTAFKRPREPVSASVLNPGSTSCLRI